MIYFILSESENILAGTSSSILRINFMPFKSDYIAINSKHSYKIVSRLNEVR